LAGGGAGQAEAPVLNESLPKATIMVRARACACERRASLAESNLTSLLSQVRLTNGKRMKATLNLSHTVGHLHALVAAEGHAAEPYVLMGGFPPTQLADPAQTVEAAGLAGSQVTQKRV
jgi:hypothetical protein